MIDFLAVEDAEDVLKYMDRGAARSD